MLKAISNLEKTGSDFADGRKQWQLRGRSKREPALICLEWESHAVEGLRVESQ